MPKRCPERPCEKCGKTCRARPGSYCHDCEMADYDSEEELDALIAEQRPTMPADEPNQRPAYRVSDPKQKRTIRGREFCDVPMRMRVRTDRRHNGFPIY